jgi:formamidopyrimidine-DNA glycosylase
MPELPDVAVYCERIERFFLGRPLLGMRVASPFVLRTFAPPSDAFSGRKLRAVTRIGKRVAFQFEGDLWCVVHLMIAGRLKLREPGAALPKKLGLYSWDFESHSLHLTEAGSKKRASVHLMPDEASARSLDRGGLEPLQSSFLEFFAVLQSENRTLKRALSDPRLLSGIGNAYSDEILFWAQLSPVSLTSSLTEQSAARLYVATRHTLGAWIKKLRQEVGDGFPEKVTAFRPEMAVHGRYKQPCRMCGTPVQRIVYQSNETNYCPTCQTGGRLLSDRALSRLLRKDWPKSLEDLEELTALSRARFHHPQQ